MFKKKTQNPDDFTVRRNDLRSRLQDAEVRLGTLRAEAVTVASSDPDRLAGLSESAFRLEFEICALTEALNQVERDIVEAEELARREADKLQRQQTCGELHKLADGLEKAVAPVPDALKTLQGAIGAVLPIIGPNGLADLLGNLSAEIPSAVELFILELRTRADQTLAGTAPATMPAPPVLTIVEESMTMPTISIFTLESLSWIDERGQRQGCGPFQIRGLPTKAAKIALERGLAIAPDSDRYKQMRETARKVGWPHLADAQKIYDLDRPVGTTSVYSGGRKIREEPMFEIMASRPPYQVEIDV